MIVEQRTYTMKPGKAAEFLRLYEAEGLALAVGTLGNLVGFFTTEFGTLNQVIHMWGFEDLNDRARLRAELAAKPAWEAFLAKIRPLIDDQVSVILIPAPFSPIR